MIKIKEGFQGERATVLPPFIIQRMIEDPLLSTLYITDIGYYPRAEYHHRLRREAIDQYVLIHCVNGKGSYRIGENEEWQTLQTNQFVFLPAGQAHEYMSSEKDPWTIYWLHFSGSQAQYYADNAGVAQTLQTSSNSRISELIARFEELFNALQNGYGDDNIHYCCSLLHYYLGSMRYMVSYTGTPNDDTLDSMEAAQHFMRENLERKLSLQDIADYIGLSASHFSLTFKRQTGHSPIFYLNMLKIKEACELLDTTNMQINQVSYKVGFEDPLYFSRLFSKFMGQSPSEYKKRVEKN